MYIYKCAELLHLSVNISVCKLQTCMETCLCKMYACLSMQIYVYTHSASFESKVSSCPHCSLCFREVFRAMVLASTTPAEVLAWSQTVVPAHVFWQYLNESNQFVNMPAQYSLLHEQHLRAGTMAFEYDVSYCRGTKTYHYEVNLTNMTQLNTGRNTFRNLRRLVVCPPLR